MSLINMLNCQDILGSSLFLTYPFKGVQGRAETGSFRLCLRGYDPKREFRIQVIRYQLRLDASEDLEPWERIRPDNRFVQMRFILLDKVRWSGNKDVVSRFVSPIKTNS